jgi:hypothetical protein
VFGNQRSDGKWWLGGDDRPLPGFTDGTQVAANVGRVMKPTGTGFTAPLATEEEIAAGRFFENVDQFKAANAA